MLRYLTGKNPHFYLFLAAAPLRALCAVALAGALGAAVDYAGGGELTESWKYLLAFVLFILLDLAVDVLDQYARFRTLRRAMISLSRDLNASLTRMSLARFRERSVTDYLSVLTSDTELVRESFFRTVLGMYVDTLCGLAALGALLWVSPILGVFVAAVSLAQSLVPMAFTKKLERAGGRYSDCQERRMRALRDTMSGFLTAKVFHIEDRLEKRCGEAVDRAEASRARMDLTRECSNSVSYGFNQTALLGVFLLGAVLHIRGVVTLSQVVAASQLISYISDPVLWLNGDLADFRSVREPIRKLRAILSEPADRPDSAVKAPTQTMEEVAAGEISLHGLTFSYGDRTVLDGITRTFRPRGKYLICGPSGGGKSTLLTLIAGLRDDYRGTVTLSGADLRTLDRENIAGRVCLLDQEPWLFDDTLMNNVTLFDPGPDRNRAEDALRRAGLGPLTETLPRDVETPLGEGANRPSGGERQRLTVARALYRGTPILLLDESTSHLDPATAAEVERTVMTLPGVTVLLVSHNPTETARKMADEVLELRGGRLVSA